MKVKFSTVCKGSLIAEKKRILNILALPVLKNISYFQLSNRR